MARPIEGSIYAHAIAALVCLLGCAPGVVPRAPSGALEARAEVAQAPAAPDPAMQLRMRRLANLDERLHPIVRELIHAEHEEERWARDGLLSLPASRCAAAIGTPEVTTNSCSLIGVGDGRVALLVLGAPRGCEGIEDPCVERSWVFLSRHPAALALPTRRLSDFYGLRDALSRQQAGALWIAGFRSHEGAGRAARDPISYEPAELDPSRFVTNRCKSKRRPARPQTFRSTRCDELGGVLLPGFSLAR
jgi:hypothetical protein